MVNLFNPVCALHCVNTWLFPVPDDAQCDQCGRFVSDEWHLRRFALFEICCLSVHHDMISLRWCQIGCWLTCLSVKPRMVRFGFPDAAQLGFIDDTFRGPSIHQTFLQHSYMLTASPHRSPGCTACLAGARTAIVTQLPDRLNWAKAALKLTSRSRRTRNQHNGSFKFDSVPRCTRPR